LAEADVRRVVAEYARAMENRDLALYRSLKPDLSAEDERRLRQAFKETKTWRVGITVDSVQVAGDRATVRATRQDVIDGRPTKAVPQTFQLVRAGATWHIQ
jgi:RNase P/RNase MRP subunit p30